MGQLSDDVLREALQELYEQAPCGFIITLPDGTFTRVNQTFLGLTGYEQHELVSAARFQDLLTLPSMVFYENQYAPLLRMQGAVKEVAFDLRRKGRSPLPVLLNSATVPLARTRCPTATPAEAPPRTKMPSDVSSSPSVSPGSSWR